MNRLIYFLSIGFVAIAFGGCEPEVSFTEPQPAENAAKEKFKSKFRGKFLCLEDSSVLHIDKTAMVQKWHFEVESERDSLINIKHNIGDYKYDADEEDLIIKANQDSTKYVIDYKKTIFKISPSSILKYEKGIYFLNTEKTGSTWDVKILHFDTDGSLLLKDLELSEEDLEKLKTITEVEVEKDVDGDITEYKLQPTPKELKEILKSGLFEEGERFIRIK